MEERFDRLEGKIDSLITTVEQKFAGVDQKFVELETRLGTRIDGVEEKLGGLSGELRLVETRLRGHIEDVDAHLSAKLTTTAQALTAHVTEKFDALNLKVDVLHEEVKDDFRFSLEAQQGLKEQMEAGFKNQELAFKEALAPLQAAIRRANELRERAEAG